MRPTARALLDRSVLTLDSGRSPAGARPAVSVDHEVSFYSENIMILNIGMAPPVP